MESKERFYEVIAGAINIPVTQVNDSLQYQEIPEWDSVTHLSVMSALEAHFKITIDMNDILEMTSVGKIISLLEKYNIHIG